MIMTIVAQIESIMQTICKSVGILKNKTESRMTTNIVDDSIIASAAPGLPFMIETIIRNEIIKLMTPHMIPYTRSLSIKSNPLLAT